MRSIIPCARARGDRCVPHILRQAHTQTICKRRATAPNQGGPLSDMVHVACHLDALAGGRRRRSCARAPYARTLLPSSASAPPPRSGSAAPLLRVRSSASAARRVCVRPHAVRPSNLVRRAHAKGAVRKHKDGGGRQSHGPLRMRYRSSNGRGLTGRACMRQSHGPLRMRYRSRASEPSLPRQMREKSEATHWNSGCGSAGC